MRILVSEALPGEWTGELQAWCERAGHTLEYAIPSGEAILDDVVGLLTMLTVRVDGALLDRLPGLRVVSNMAVGYDNVDLEACRARGIAIGHTPGVLTAATADLTMALLLASARGMTCAAQDAREGRWTKWTATGWSGSESQGARLGIVGMGKIGYAVARRAHSFGLEILYASRGRHEEAETRLGARQRPLDALFGEVDFLSLHVPATPATQHLVDRARLRRMRPGAHLINTSRGAVVDQEALVEALAGAWIAGAALDVTTPEPLPASHPLFALANCLILPHIGSSTHGTRARMAALAVANLIAGVEGRGLAHPVP